MEEIFKDIKGYEGLYQVSNKGRVRILNYRKTGVCRIKKTYFKNGYERLSLCKNGKYKNYFVHRLVANTFLQNPYDLSQVNHKDEDKTNNCVSNLEWCTAKDNINYGTRNERVSKSMIGNKNFSLTTAITIKCLDLKTNEIIYYPSIMDAERQLMINHSAILYNLRKSNKPYKKRYIFTEINI